MSDQRWRCWHSLHYPTRKRMPAWVSVGTGGLGFSQHANELGQTRFYHNSRHPPFWNNLTVFEFLDAEGKPISRGYAFCSRKDQFSRKRGREIARGRALAALAARESNSCLSGGRRHDLDRS